MASVRRNVRLAGLAVGIATVLFVGCGDDDGPTDPEPQGDTGTIIIDQTPDSLAGAGWSLSGPKSQKGSGDETLTAMPAGEYALTWIAVDGYSTPPANVESLASAGSVTFSGNYSADPNQPEGFMSIPAGTFMMGSPADEPERSTHEVQHQVTLTKGFYISKWEVTEAWWYEVMGGTPTTSKLPAYAVSWDMAVAFCNALSLQEGLTPAYAVQGSNGDVTWNRSANGYRLPTEAEWEYACRAGTVMAFNNNTNCLSSDTEANYKGSTPLTGCPSGISRTARTEVGTFPPNNWGLFDMHGNVWEWVWDGYRSDYENLGSVDPVYDVGQGAWRVARGGSWEYSAQYCRSAYRSSGLADAPFIGFALRPVRSAE